MRERFSRLMPVLAVYAVLMALGFAALRSFMPVSVVGGSMRPALVPGDVVFVARAERPHVGDIALLCPAGHGPVLHRVTRLLANQAVMTRGDANRIPDFTPTAQREVAGTVVAVLPLGRLVDRWRQ